MDASVALLAEGVDRNFGAIRVANKTTRSPSSRRAWIEILARFSEINGKQVALLAEGVDRNLKKLW